jgi:hypothetical protein
MMSLIELRKQELTTEINKMIDVVQFFLDNKKRDERATSISQYLDLNSDELRRVNTNLCKIKNQFNPNSDSFETFEKCKYELEELQREINKIQARGEAEQQRLKRNAASTRYALFGAILGAVMMGFTGCVSCTAFHFNGVNLVTDFNLINGFLGGIICGAVIGAIIGQVKQDINPDHAFYWSIGVTLFLIALIVKSAFTPATDTQVNSNPAGNSSDGGRVLISECDTPCRMEVGYNQFIETGGKLVLVKFKGKKEWINLNGDPSGRIPPGKFNTGLAEFASHTNQPSIRVQILRAR